MKNNPFTTPFDALPETLPIFPLSGALVFPGAELPLNIFEPRYLNMVNDTLGSHRMIGMIQPNPAAGSDADICRIGCAGRITQYRETSDCRIEMVLSGVCRFAVVEEIPSTRGYRLVVPDWSRFAGDYSDHDDLFKDRHAGLTAALQRFFDSKGYQADMAMLARMPVSRLVDSLTVALPFSNLEKQMLLETVEAEKRLEHFMALIDGQFEVPDSATRH